MGKRDIESVLGDVLGLVPGSETQLRAKLLSIRRSANFCPPEGMGIHWQRLEDTLVESIGVPTEQWHRDIATAVRGVRC